MRYSLAEPAHGPVDFQLTLHGSAVVERFAESFVDSELVAPDSELVVGFVIVDFAHLAVFQRQSNLWIICETFVRCINLVKDYFRIFEFAMGIF